MGAECRTVEMTVFSIRESTDKHKHSHMCLRDSRQRSFSSSAASATNHKSSEGSTRHSRSSCLSSASDLLKLPVTLECIELYKIGEQRQVSVGCAFLTNCSQAKQVLLGTRASAATNSVF